MNKKVPEIIGEATYSIARDCALMVGFVGEVSAAIGTAIRKPGKIRWRETFYYMDMCGSDAVPIVTLICFLMGVILGFQGAIQMHKFGTDIFVADLVGISIVEELGPLMVAMIATGRAGSAFAAEIGTMKVSEEIDAMQTMGFIPCRFLVVPKLIAMVVVMPVLTLYGNIAGILGGMVVGCVKLGLPVVTYYNRTMLAIKPMYLIEGLSKSAVFALLIAVMGCMRGFEAQSDAQGVGRSATSAVVSSIFLVIVADSVLTILYNTVVYTS